MLSDDWYCGPLDMKAVKFCTAGRGLGWWTCPCFAIPTVTAHPLRASVPTV